MQNSLLFNLCGAAGINMSSTIASKLNSQISTSKKPSRLSQKETEQQIRAKRIKIASHLARNNSMKINFEFSEIEHDPKNF